MLIIKVTIELFSALDEARLVASFSSATECGKLRKCDTHGRYLLPGSCNSSNTKARRFGAALTEKARSSKKILPSLLQISNKKENLNHLPFNSLSNDEKSASLNFKYRYLTLSIDT